MSSGAFIPIFSSSVPTPSFQHSFMGETLPSGFVFARASVATRFNGSGFIESVSSGAARFDYNPAGTPSLRGLLIDPAATNLALHSNDFSNAVWNYVNSSRTTPSATNLDGSGTVQKLTENSSTANHFVFQSVAKAASSLAYSLAVYCKADGRSHCFLQLEGTGGTNGANAHFNLSTGGIITSGTFGTGFAVTGTRVDDAGNGWWRVVLSVTSNADTVISALVLLSDGSGTFYLGNGTSGIYLYGAQLEQSAFATSYIATTTASATRAAETLVATSPSWLSAAGPHSVAIDCQMPNYINTSSDGVLVRLDDNATTNIVQLNRNTSGTLVLFNRSAGVDTGFVSGAVAGLANLSMCAAAGSFNTNNYRLAYNGASTGTPDTSGALALSISRVRIGSSASANQPSAWFKNFTYWSRRLSNIDLAQAAT